METITYTPKAAEPRPAPYHKILVNWSHGFQHTLVCTGNNLMGQLKDLDGIFYVKEVLHWEITRAEYDEFFNAPFEDEGPEEILVEKKSRGKKSGLKFSTLDNFFKEENTVEQKTPGRKSRRK
jgi:hypothetical protein